MLRRMVLLLAVTALLVLALAVPAFADKGGVPNWGTSGGAELCRAVAGTPPEFPPGSCTSFFAGRGGLGD
jgi:hypothetical protein